MDLGSAPPVPVSEGNIEFGTYRGSCTTTALDLDFGFGRSRLTRLRHERKYQRFWGVDETIALYGSVVDAGPVGFASLWVFDRAEQELLADAASVLPPFVVRIADDPMADPTAVARFLDCRMTLGYRGDTVRVSGRLESTKFTLGYETPAAAPITAVCPIDGRETQRVLITEKSACLPMTGWLNADTETGNGGPYRFGDDAVGMLEYAHGLFDRRSEWRGAIASGHAVDGTPVGFTVMEGVDGLANVVWIDGVPQRIGSATIVSDEEWRIEADDGDLSVTLDVEHTHDRTASAGPISHDLTQPFGLWKGTVAGRDVQALRGVGEHHEANW